jgi:hypothetical protein
MLVSLLMTLVIAGALFTVFVNTFQSREVVVGQGTAETSARTPIDDLADHLRDAQYHKIGSGTSVTDYSVIADAAATSVTYYKSDSATDTVQYWLDGTDLKRTADGTTTVVLGNVNKLEFVYYKTGVNGNYNNSVVAQTDNASAPTAAERPYLSQIKITASVTIDGFQRELASLVRLRNSPYKVHL